VISPARALTRIAVVAAALACAVGLGAAGSAAAKAKAPTTQCWKTLLNDWYDGRIDNTYPVSCYKQALHHLPTDVQTYSSARDDILRAMQSAIAQLHHSHKKVTSTTPLPAQSGGGGSNGGGGNGGNGGGGGGSSTTNPNGPLPGNHTPGGIPSATKASSPSSIPVPLLVLGGLALLLIAAGAVGVVAKRWQRRNPPPASS
jgi:hypothetical protein